jgi:starch phosphorylase
LEKEKMDNVQGTQAGPGAPYNKVLKEDRKIAYFSMEIGIDAKIPTYGGGLGILAGDTIKSCADLRVPLVAVTLLYRKGYFRQELGQNGMQKELPCEWNPADFLELLPYKVSVTIENRTVLIQAWKYRVVGINGFYVPVIFLDTDVADNSDFDRGLSYYLYGGDEKYRIAQEAILGIGGVRMLREAGYKHLNKYHMNEGHSSLLTLELLKEKKK